MNKIFTHTKNVLLSIAALALLSLTSCEHKDLVNNLHATEVEVVFDWQKAPDAAPASMSLYLFPLKGGEPLRYEFTDHRGGVIRVPVGDYDALCINSDTENIIYRNTESKHTFEVTTREANALSGLSAMGVLSADLPRAKGAENERIALPPDMLWSGHVEGLRVRLGSSMPRITLCPEMSVCRFTIDITSVQNLKYVSGIAGTISGMAGGLLPGLGADAVTKERVTFPFDVIFGDSKSHSTTITSSLLVFGKTRSDDSATISGSLLTFGDFLADETHTLSIYVILANGEKWYYTFDVTSQTHLASDPRNVHIILDGLPVPKPIVNGGGFHPQVNDWNTVSIDINM